MSIEYTFGQIIIDGNTYTSDCIIYKEKVIPNWKRKKGHLLKLRDIKDLLKGKVDTLVVGTGYSGIMKVDDSLKTYCKKNGIILADFPTKKAINYYESLKNKKRTILAVHITC